MNADDQAPEPECRRPSGSEAGVFTGQWDPSVIRRLMAFGAPVFKTYFRAEVRDIDRIPPGGALVVSNHSGGPTTVDVPTLWLKFFERFGWDRPIYTLGHDILFKGPTAAVMRRLGMIRASRENAAAALRSGAVVIVFPGGDNDAMRPTRQQAVIDFFGRTGYITTALEAEGLIQSVWDDKDSQGPPRRIYSITGDGEEILTQYMEKLKTSRKQIDHLIEVYEKSAAPNKGN